MENLSSFFKRFDSRFTILLSGFLSAVLLYIPVIIPSNIGDEPQRLIYASTFSLIGIYSNYGKDYVFALSIVIMTAALFVFQLILVKISKEKRKFAIILALSYLLLATVFFVHIVNRNISVSILFVLYFTLFVLYQLFATASIVLSPRGTHFSRKRWNPFWIRTISASSCLALTIFLVLLVLFQYPEFSFIDMMPTMAVAVVLAVLLIVSFKHKAVSNHLGPIQIVNSFLLLTLQQMVNYRFYRLNGRMFLILIPIVCFLSGVVSYGFENEKNNNSSECVFGSKVFSISFVLSVFPFAFPLYKSVSTIHISQLDELVSIPFVPALSFFKWDSSFFYGKDFDILYPLQLFFFIILILSVLYSINNKKLYLILGSVFSGLCALSSFIITLINRSLLNLGPMAVVLAIYLSISALLIVPVLMKKYEYEDLPFGSGVKWLIFSAVIVLSLLLEWRIVDGFSLWGTGAGYYTLPVFVLSSIASFFLTKDGNVFDATSVMLIGDSACVFFKGILQIGSYGNFSNTYNLVIFIFLIGLAVLSFFLQSNFKKLS